MNNLKTSKVLALVVALAMVLAVVPSFVASAADDEVVLFDMSAIEFTGEVEVGAYGLTANGHVRLNEKNWKDGAWTNPGDGLGDKTLTFFKSTGGSGNDLTETAAFNNATASTEAGKIVVDFIFAARDDANDNYVTWYFEDLDGNAFARFFWDDGKGVWEEKDPETEEVIASGQNAEANFGVNETKAIVARSETSRDEVLALRGQAFQVEAVKGDEGYTVTYKKGEEVLGTETIEAINGFKQIKAQIGGWSTQWSGMGLQDLKVVASDFPSNSTIGSVSKAFAEITVPVIADKDLDLAADVTDEFGTKVDVEWTTSDDAVIAADGKVADLDAVGKATLTASVTFAGETVTKDFTVYVPAASKAGKEITVGESVYTVGTENKISNGTFDGLDDWTNAENGGALEGTWAVNAEYGVNGNAAARTGGNTGGAGANTLRRYVELPEGTYYVSYYAYNAAAGTNGMSAVVPVKYETAPWGTFDGLTFKNFQAYGGHNSWSAESQSEVKVNRADINYAGGLEKFEYVITLEDANAILISFGAHAGNVSPYISNFEIYDVTVEASMVDATVEYKAGDVTIKTVSAKAWPGETVEFPGQTFVQDGVIYTVADATAVAGEDATVVEATVVRENAIKSLTTTTGGATRWPDNGGYLTAVSGGDINIVDEDGVALADNAAGWTPYGSTRKLTATFDAPEVKDGEVAVLHLAVGAIRKNNGNNVPVAIRAQVGANDAVAYTTALVDSTNGAVVKTYVTADVTDLVKGVDGEVAIEVTAMAAIALVDEVQAGYNGSEAGFASYIEVVPAVATTVEGAATVTVNGKAGVAASYAGAVVRAYDAEGNALLINGAAEAVAGEELVATEAAAVTAALGFYGDNLTIDFTTNVPGAVAVVTSNVANAVVGTVAADAVVSVVPANANVTYTVTVQTANGKAIAGAEAASAALYPLVVEDLAKNIDKYTAAEELFRFDSAVKAINEGGFVVGVNEVIKAIATVETAENGRTTVTINDKLFALGLGFKVGAKVGTEENVNPLESEELLQSIQINADGTVTIEGVGTFSLDSVVIEFVATEVADSAADGADAEFDFTTEL